GRCGSYALAPALCHREGEQTHHRRRPRLQGSGAGKRGPGVVRPMAAGGAGAGRIGAEMTSAGGTLPLGDLRVLELGHIVAGPSAGLILADLGADVIKIERPDGGDQARRMPGGVSAIYYSLNRNKRSFAVDLKAPAGKALFLRLVQSAD